MSRAVEVERDQLRMYWGGCELCGGEYRLYWFEVMGLGSKWACLSCCERVLVGGG